MAGRDYQNDPHEMCPISRANFLRHARPIHVHLVPDLIGEGGQIIEDSAEVKEYSTGSFGWMLGRHAYFVVDGETVQVWCQVTLTVCGSKEVSRQERERQNESREDS